MTGAMCEVCNAIDPDCANCEITRNTNQEDTMTATAKPGKCPNRIPSAIKDAQGRPLRYAVCPSCGGYFAILASNLFRTHAPIFKPGDPRIQENMASMDAKVHGSAAPIKHL